MNRNIEDIDKNNQAKFCSKFKLVRIKAGSIKDLSFGKLRMGITEEKFFFGFFTKRRIYPNFPKPNLNLVAQMEYYFNGF